VGLSEKLEGLRVMTFDIDQAREVELLPSSVKGE
jgi:hypothetical protein